MKRFLFVVMLALVALPVVAQTGLRQPPLVSRIVLPQVALRDGVFVDLSLTVFTNPNPCHDRAVLAVHGMLHTAAAWEPLATELMAQPPGLVPCRILAIDLPGHGRSGLPSGALFGELTVDDYVTAALGTLERLQRIGIHPDTVLGHSLGGAILTLAQQRLKAYETDLSRAFGVRNVVMLAPAVLNPIPLAQWDSGAAFAPLFAFTQNTLEMGWHVAVPVPVWRAFMFLNLAMPPQAAVGAPSVADIIAHGYFGPQGSAVAPESRAMLDAIVPRPTVDAGLFGPESGTKLTMVAYEQDRVVKLEKELAFYVHLTGDTAAVRFTVVGGPDAVHDTHISAPALLFTAAPWLLTAF